MKTDQSLYFIALVPPEPIVSEVKSFKETLFQRYQTKVALKSPAHITLYPPFSWYFSQENLIKDTLQDFAKMHHPLEIQLEGFGCFAPRVIFVKPVSNPALSSLRTALFQFLKEHINLYEKRYAQQPFNPHITIANRDLKKEDFQEAWAEFKNQAYEATFLADKLYLLKHNGHSWDLDYHVTLES